MRLASPSLESLRRKGVGIGSLDQIQAAGVHGPFDILVFEPSGLVLRDGEDVSGWRLAVGVAQWR